MIAVNMSEDQPTPVQYSPEEQVFVDRFLELFPQAAPTIHHPEAAQQVRDLMAQSILPNLTARGLVLASLTEETFRIGFFDTSPDLMAGVIEEDEWDLFLSQGSTVTGEFLETWLAWQREEAWELFREEYQIKDGLSRLTANRWENFKAAWGEVTREARREVFTRFLAGLDEDPDLAMEWQLTFATGAWDRQVEVPWVSNELEAGSDEERAVPTGASGKAISL